MLKLEVKCTSNVGFFEVRCCRATLEPQVPYRPRRYRPTTDKLNGWVYFGTLPSWLACLCSTQVKHNSANDRPDPIAESTLFVKLLSLPFNADIGGRAVESAFFHQSDVILMQAPNVG